MSSNGIFMKNKIFRITRIVVVTINNRMSGLVNRGLIEYFCNLVTMKKLVKITEKINKK